MADLSRFDASIAGLRSLDSVAIPVTPDLTGFLERIRALLAGEEVSIRVVPDLDDFDARIRAHSPPDVTVNVNTNVDSDRFSRALSGLAGIVGRVGSALTGLLKFGAIGIAAAGAAQGVLVLGAALAPAAGIIAAFPALILGFQAALGALRLALTGVSEAFGAALTGTGEEFTKALEDLSPAARAAAREVRAMKPAFEALRNSVQDAFFSQFEGQLTAVGKALNGPLRQGLTNIAAQWGRAARGVTGYLQSAKGVSNVKSILGGAEAAVGGLATTTNKLTAGFLQVAAVISDRFGPELASGISNLGERFGEFLQRIASSGDAVRWVDQALTVFAQLGGILQNVGSIISSVFNAANVSGAGLLANIQKITGSFAAFASSAQGQEAIGNIFRTVGTIAAQLGPILAALVTQIGAIAPALAPVFTALGPALTGLINSLGPALAAIAPALQGVATALAQAFAAIGPSLGPLGAAIGAVVTALAPLLPLVGELVAVIAQMLAPVLQNLVALFAPIIQALVGALMPVLPQISQAFTMLVTAMQPLYAGCRPGGRAALPEPFAGAVDAGRLSSCG